MAKLDFTISIQNYSNDPNVGSTDGQIELAVIANTVSGTPYFRTYLTGDEAGEWTQMNAVVNESHKNIFFLAAGQYQCDYKDDAGERPLIKFRVHSNAELQCLNVTQDFVLTYIIVRPNAKPASPLVVLGYPTYTGEIAVNAGAFKSWASGGGAVFSDAELAGLGVLNTIDQIRFQIPGKCILTIAEDLHYGEPGASELKATFEKTNCTEAGATDGTITITPSGGSGNYSFAWDDGPITQDRISLAPGSYSVTITDTTTLESVLLANIEITAPAAVSEDVTEDITIEVRRPSCDASKSVYLCWLNSLSGWDQWLFEDKNEVFQNEVSVRTNHEFSRYVERLDEASGETDYLSRTARRSMTLGTGKIGPDQIEGFAELYSSSKVLMLTSAPDVRPPVWTDVKVKDGSFSYNDKTQEAEIVIELPNLNIQPN